MKLKFTTSKFKTKKEAYTKFIYYLITPYIVFLLFWAYIGKFSAQRVYTPDQTRQEIGIAIVVVALVLIYSWYKMFRLFFVMNSKDYETWPEGDIPETVKCLNCLEPFAGNKLTTLKCPKCGGSLEDLRGFFERHPDLRNDEDK